MTSTWRSRVGFLVTLAALAACSGAPVVSVDTGAGDAAGMDMGAPVDAPPSCAPSEQLCSARCVDVSVDPRNCGRCGAACGAGEACTAGRCATSCPAGQTACGGQCVNAQTDRANCGGCGMACPAGQVCVAGRCAVECSAPLVLCAGACVDTRFDPMNCGLCGMRCASGTCSSGRCVGSDCPTGFADCDGNAANMCEANLQTDPARCGTCSTVCPGATNATASCVAGRCRIECAMGFADCDGNTANGCEIDTRVSLAHCGACGAACMAAPNAMATCVAGRCAPSCVSGFADCNASPADGCEVDVRTSGANCGMCGRACAAGTACTAGTCVMTAPRETGSGVDGTLVVNGVVNLNTDRAGSTRAGTFADGVAYQVRSVTPDAIVATATANGIAAGDRVLLIFMQSTGATTDVGNFDVLDVTSVTGDTISVPRGSIDTTKYDDGAQRFIVVQRVPQYSSVTIGTAGVITASPWDALATLPSGAAGVRTGIVAFAVSGTLTNGGTITAAELGFRGGADNNNDYTNGYGFQGEGIAGGWGARSSGLGAANVGGGSGGLIPSTGCCHGNGGGGGGYAGAGGAGSIDGGDRVGPPPNGAMTPGGQTYGVPLLTRLFLGSGGGSGGSYSGTNAGCAPSDAECNAGGRGGGIVYIAAHTFMNNRIVSANGQLGFPQPGTAGCAVASTTNTQDGSGGSGSGGSIYLVAPNTLTNGGQITADGAAAGCMAGWPAPNVDRQRGGAGGAGRVRVRSPAFVGSTSPAAVVTPS